jgi:hypothetical protein
MAYTLPRNRGRSDIVGPARDTFRPPGASGRLVR